VQRTRSCAEAAAHAARLGVAGFLTKPYDLDALVALVERHTRGS
jgi:DNA-binding NtrC family response regulator